MYTVRNVSIIGVLQIIAIAAVAAVLLTLFGCSVEGNLGVAASLDAGADADQGGPRRGFAGADGVAIEALAAPDTLPLAPEVARDLGVDTWIADATPVDVLPVVDTRPSDTLIAVDTRPVVDTTPVIAPDTAPECPAIVWTKPPAGSSSEVAWTVNRSIPDSASCFVVCGKVTGLHLGNLPYRLVTVNNVAALTAPNEQSGSMPFTIQVVDGKYTMRIAAGPAGSIYLTGWPANSAGTCS